jgi:hypothetical protein
MHGHQNCHKVFEINTDVDLKDYFLFKKFQEIFMLVITLISIFGINILKKKELILKI